MAATVIREISDLLSASRSVSSRSRLAWWRGQGQSTWTLQPKVHRVQAHDVYESNIITKFMQLAPARHARCPGVGDRAQWLFLAQHYGLPTRLLDWSESPLVALYFAVADEANDSKSGAIWSLDPFALNRSSIGANVVLSSASDDVLRLIHAAFNHEAQRTEEWLALFPDEVDVRLMVQLAGFTIHGSPAPLDRSKGRRSFLQRFVIPRRVKASLRDELRTLGIRQRSIFPDLYNLSLDLARGSL